MTSARDIFRTAASLRVEAFSPSHPAPDAPEGQRGAGTVVGTWIACEEPGHEEGWLTSGIELVMDSRLEPGAVIGRHHHATTEELYLVLEGLITVTATDEHGVEHRRTLEPGDVHRLGPGGTHSARAGADGARIVVIAARAS